jgi:hypothetical protein
MGRAGFATPILRGGAWKAPIRGGEGTGVDGERMTRHGTGGLRHTHPTGGVLGKRRSVGGIVKCE